MNSHANTAVSRNAYVTPCTSRTARKGQNGRRSVHPRNVIANSREENMIKLFSEYLLRALPARNLENNDETLKIPTRRPIVAALDPNRARYTGSAGARAKKASKKEKNVRKPRMKLRLKCMLPQYVTAAAKLSTGKDTVSVSLKGMVE